MVFDWPLLLICACAAFGLGWLASRLDILHWRIEARHKPKAYFKGLNFLLGGQQDLAVDAFIEAVQNDPDTSELHFTLGNLFRRRGEYDRAVRVHEHLLARSDLSKTDRLRAQFALAQDYWRAGLMDRAEHALNGLESTEALQLLLLVHERARDWAKADAVALKLQQSGLVNFDKRRAHYLCEQQRFAEAIELCPTAPRAYAMWAQQMAPEQAFSCLSRAIHQSPQAAPLLAKAWLESATTEAERTAALGQLQTIYHTTRSLDVLQALIASGAQDAQTAYLAHLKLAPSLIAAKQLITTPDLQTTLDLATQPLLRFRCASCGFETKEYFWQCPGCHAWDSYPYQRIEELS